MAIQRFGLVPVISATMRGVVNDVRAAQLIRFSGRAQLGIFVLGLIFFGAFYLSGHAALSRPIIYSAFEFAFAICLKWPLRCAAWFWITVVVLAAIHVPVILALQGTKWQPGPFITALVLVGLIVMLVVLNLVEQVLSALKGAATPQRRRVTI